MSAAAIRSGVYRVENGALVRVRSFLEPVVKVHENSADRIAAAKAALGIAAASSTPRSDLRNFMKWEAAR